MMMVLLLLMMMMIDGGGGGHHELLSVLAGCGTLYLVVETVALLVQARAELHRHARVHHLPPHPQSPPRSNAPPPPPALQAVPGEEGGEGS